MICEALCHYVCKRTGIRKGTNDSFFSVTVVDDDSNAQTFFTSDPYAIQDDLKLGDTVIVVLNVYQTASGARIILKSVQKGG